MTLTYEETDIALALDTKHDEIVYYCNKIKGNKKAQGEFQMIPNQKMGFDVIYLCGAMGQGKTYQTCKIGEMYRRIYPENNIYIFSQKDKDPSFDDSKTLGARRVLINETFNNKEIDIVKSKEFHNSMLIFDDFMSFSNKNTVKNICDLLIQCITLGRQYHIYTVITSHLFYTCKNRDLYMNLYNEVQKIYWFRGVNAYQLRYVLKNYWGYSNKQIEGFLNFDRNSRYTMINRYPAVLQSRTRMMTIQ
jgi:hypothetical protein